MKSKYLIASALGLLSAASLTGCYDMDTLPYSQNVTEQQKGQAVEANPEMAQASITGITALFSVCEAIFSERDDTDYGFASVMVYLESRGIDFVADLSGYNWYQYSTALFDCRVTDPITDMTWGTCYNQIFAANAALKNISAESQDPELQFYRAQALAIRAFDYFTLAQAYQFTYYGNEDKPCVMLITEENEAEATADGIGRASVKDIYAQIMKDLNEAVTLIEASKLKPEQVLDAQPKRFLSAAAIHGLRARVNLVMHEWDDAAQDAQDAIQLFAGAPTTPETAKGPGFASLSESDWMWGIAIAETDRVVTTAIVNWPSHMGSLNDGYATAGAWRRINKALYNYIPESDVRKTWFLDGEGFSAGLTEAQQAFITDAEPEPYTQVKFAPYQNVLGTANNANDIPLMRIEEMYYILAEAQAMGSAGPGAGTQTLVNFVKTYRDPEYSFAGGSAEAVQDEIWMQRRVELWGEGLSTFDLMRLKKPFDRRGGGWGTTLVYDVQPNDPVLLLCIPQSEVNGNKAFTQAENNQPQSRPQSVADIEE